MPTSSGWPPEEQVDGVWSVLNAHTFGEHSADCQARVYECVDEVLNDRNREIRTLIRQRDIEAAANMRLIRENQQMRDLIHTLTARPESKDEEVLES